MGSPQSVPRRKRRITFTELFVVIILVGILSAILVPALYPADSGRWATCQNQLKQFGLIAMVYANETSGEFYPPTTSRGLGVLYQKSIYPEYLTDLSILLCPSDSLPIDTNDLSKQLFTHPNGAVDSEFASQVEGMQEGFPIVWSYSYFYRPYVLTSDADDDSDPQSSTYSASKHVKATQESGVPFTDANAVFHSHMPISGDMPACNEKGDPIRTDGTHEAGTFLAIRNGVERFAITDINNADAIKTTQSKISVMMDKFKIGEDGILECSHVPKGCNVLYMDGHVGFVRYPGTSPDDLQPEKFPITRHAAKSQPF